MMGMRIRWSGAELRPLLLAALTLLACPGAARAEDESPVAAPEKASGQSGLGSATAPSEEPAALERAETAGFPHLPPTPDPRLEAPPALSAPPAAQLAPVAPPADCTRIVRLVIDKSERRLAATCADGTVRSFRIALGQLPLGYKREQHDLRTPEGFYRIAESPRGSRFHVFMMLDYPSLADADRALSSGYINARTYLRIARAVARGEVPPQDTALGGMIGIHGEGSEHQGDSRKLDWTLGCIALTDSDAEYIAYRIDVGTPVSIEP